MGYAGFWVAVRGRARDEILGVLGLRATGVREELSESPFVVAELPGGWHVVVSSGAVGRLSSERVLTSLSTGCDVVTCFVEEHVMVSAASGWRDGRRIWSVLHDAQRETEEHLEIEGDPPAAFAGIRESLHVEQARGDADYTFDVPVELAKSLCGYRHDEDISGAGDTPFEVLVASRRSSPRRGKAPSLWKRLFGG